mmetsp:Transcript_14432/g.21421  ORF Transcript_14432/g.21421 Transcript_14432/m.21421 type:complete len:315 (-) Transcript_14432:172-1116(-)
MAATYPMSKKLAKINEEMCIAFKSDENINVATTSEAKVAFKSNDESSRIQESTFLYRDASNYKAKNKKFVRKGKWTAEEEAYTSRIIHDFQHGFLNIPEGTTLRSYLSEKLYCDPMRITKKFAGGACIGKKVFSPCKKTPENLVMIMNSMSELNMLENKFKNRMKQQSFKTKLGDKSFYEPFAMKNNFSTENIPSQSSKGVEKSVLCFDGIYDTPKIIDCSIYCLPRFEYLSKEKEKAMYENSFWNLNGKGNQRETNFSKDTFREFDNANLLLNFFHSVQSQKTSFSPKNSVLVPSHRAFDSCNYPSKKLRTQW